MHITAVVQIEVERTEGKFASREELEDQIVEALEDANPQSPDGEMGGTYEVIEWSVEIGEPQSVRPQKTKSRRSKVADRLKAADPYAGWCRRKRCGCWRRSALQSGCRSR
jgi:hypothetical protein